MKYGLIYKSGYTNIDCDIQTFAAKQLLPRVDYYIDGEYIDSFKSDNDEPVMAIFSGWWMKHKWNWPPQKCVIPKFVGFSVDNTNHYTTASPVLDEWLDGVGGEYFKSYGPVGVYSKTAKEILENKDIPCSHSGNLALTINSQGTTEKKGKYILSMDGSHVVNAKVKEIADYFKLEYVEETHYTNYEITNPSIEQRMDNVKKLIILIENAKAVVTSNYNDACICIALGVPAIYLNQKASKDFKSMIKCIGEKELVVSSTESFFNLATNKKYNQKYSEAIKKDISDFIAELENKNQKEIVKTTYTNEQAKLFKRQIMEYAIDRWLYSNRGFILSIKDSNKTIRSLRNINK